MRFLRTWKPTSSYIRAWY